jgi:hypothetical protein
MNKERKIEKFLEEKSNEFFSNLGLPTEQLFVGLVELLKVKALLNYKDLRSVIQWCTKNKVFIIRQGNKKYVNKWEFIISFHKQFIKHLKEKHKNWKEIFIAYIKGDLRELVSSPEEKLERGTANGYKPKTDIEISFMSKIKKL